MTTRHIAPVRRLAGVAVLLIIAATLTVASTATDAQDLGTPTAVQRHAGTSRFDTARLIAVDAFPDADHAVIARGEDWPDALAGSFLAGVVNGPVLLVARDRVPQEALDALTAIGITDLTILGGTVAISDDTQAALVAAGYRVDRIFGQTRYETAVAVAERATAADRGATAIVATGENFADALVVGPLAWSEGFPLLLTSGAELHPATREYLTDPTITDVIIPGGTNAVSAAVEAELVAMGKSVTRLSGPGRVETAVAIAEHAIAELGYTADTVLLATANPFADALTLGAAAGAGRNPLLITPGEQATLAPALDAFLRTRACDVTGVTIAGGDNAFGTPAETAVLAALDDCDPTPTPTTTATPTPTPAPTPTEEPTATPALLSGIARVGTQDGATTYRFTFDQPVAADNLAAMAARFRLYAPYTSQIIIPFVQPLYAQHRPFINFGDTATADPADPASVLVAFQGAFWDGVGDVRGSDLVTVAAVAAGAVTNAEGTPNPETSVGVQAVSFAAGQTLGPNLTGVSDVNLAAGTVRFRFDKDVDVLFDTAFHLVVQPPGDVQPVTLASTGAVDHADGRSVVASFGPDLTADADIRRAHVLDGAVEGTQIFGPFTGTPLSTTQSVAVASGGDTRAPDLIGITENQGEGYLDFSFGSQLPNLLDPDPARFLLYFVDGSLQPGVSAELLGNRQTVRVTYGDLHVTDGMLGAVAAQDAVVAVNGRSSQMDERGFARSFTSGSTAAGTWTGASITTTGSGAPRLVMTFSRPIPTVNGDERFTAYDAAGMALTGALTGCAVQGAASTQVACAVDAARADDVARVGLAIGAFSGDVVRPAFFDTRIVNHEQSRPVTAGP